MSFRYVNKIGLGDFRYVNKIRLNKIQCGYDF